MDVEVELSVTFGWCFESGSNSVLVELLSDVAFGVEFHSLV